MLLAEKVPNFSWFRIPRWLVGHSQQKYLLPHHGSMKNLECGIVYAPLHIQFKMSISKKMDDPFQITRKRWKKIHVSIYIYIYIEKCYLVYQLYTTFCFWQKRGMDLYPSGNISIYSTKREVGKIIDSKVKWQGGGDMLVPRRVSQIVI